MYLDTVVISGLVIVILMCVMLAYTYRYVMRHMRADEKKYLAAQGQGQPKTRAIVGEASEIRGASKDM